MTVEAAVRQFLSQELGKNVVEVGNSDSLLESGAIDSVGVMRLVAFLEATYGIHVQEDDLMPENFDTIAAIASFVDTRRAGGA